MKIVLVLLSFLIFSVPSFGQSTDRPQSIVIPISSIGEVSETRKQILQNTLTQELSKHFQILPQDQFERVQEKVFEELDFEECTEDQCIIRMQEVLQIENVFNLQVISEEGDTQLNLKWMNLDEKKNREDYCEDCKTKELRKRVVSLVQKLVGKTEIQPIVMRDNKKETLSKINRQIKRSSSIENETSNFSLSLINPVQFPNDDSDIYGFRFNLFYGRHENVSGVDLTFIGLSHTKKSKGIQLTWVGVNWTETMNGVQVVPVGINYAKEYSHTQFGMVGINYTETSTGQYIMGINVSTKKSDFQLGFVNYSHTANTQIGLINVTTYLEGFQIGILNINMNSKVPYGFVLPFFNSSF